MSLDKKKIKRRRINNLSTEITIGNHKVISSRKTGTAPNEKEAIKQIEKAFIVRVSYNGKMLTFDELGQAMGAYPDNIFLADKEAEKLGVYTSCVGAALWAGFKKLSDQDQTRYKEIYQEHINLSGPQKKMKVSVTDKNPRPELKTLQKKLIETNELMDQLNNKMRTFQTPEEQQAEQQKYQAVIDKFNELTNKQIEANNKRIKKLEAELKAGKEKIRAIKEKRLVKKRAVFAMPSHPLMFTLLAMFAGKPERIPRKLLEKLDSKRTPEEQKKANEFLNNILTKETEPTYPDNESSQKQEEVIYTAIVSDNPKVEATAEISETLFSGDSKFREESLAIYINRTYGAEGLRHLLGLIIGLEENFRQGHFEWEINEHLNRLGYKRGPGGAYKPEVKKIATEIVKIFASFFITTTRKDGADKKEIEGKKLFSIDGFKVELFKKEIIKGTILLRATDFWYQHSFDPPEGQGKMYTKLLKKIAQENHRNHPLTLLLAPLFAIFWRMNPNYKLSVKSLMGWCSLDIKDSHKKESIRTLEAEFNYMKSQGHLGEWVNGGECPLPSDCKDPLNCILTFTPPDWLKKELKQIADKKEEFLLEPETKNTVLSKEEFSRLVNNTGLSQRQFANNLGISAQMVGYIIRGKKKITHRISEKTREVFGHILPV